MIVRAPEQSALTRLVSVGIAGVLMAVSVLAPEAVARPLDAIRARGILSLCAHPNALPFASRTGAQPGFQIELARALSDQLGVELSVEWVTTRFQFRTVDCDVVLDTIAVPEAQAGRRLELSKPYQRSGVALALRRLGQGINGFGDLDRSHRVGVLVGSLASTVLGQRGVRVVSFGFEDEMVEAVVRGEIEAAAINPATVGYFNLNHPDRALQLIHAYESEPELGWDVTIGMRRSDPALREAIDRAIDGMLADGTVRQIYARYGIEHRPPKAP